MADAGITMPRSWGKKVNAHLAKLSPSQHYCGRLSYLVSAFSPVDLKESGLRETFIKRYQIERTNNEEIRPEEQSAKAELSGEFMGGQQLGWSQL